MKGWELRQKQSLPLEAKIIMSQQRIKQWFEYWEGDVYVAFSGGKDSTVLLDLVRDLYPHVPAIFFDTGLEYPEIREFVKSIDNVEWIKPKKNFKQIIEDHGYPIISKEQSQYIREARSTNSEKLRNKRLYGVKKESGINSGKISDKWQYLLNAPFKISEKCCDIMKINPAKNYEKQTNRKGFIGTMAGEGWQRQEDLILHGCNAFDFKRPLSRPLAFWLEQDILKYLKINEISFASCYGDIVYKDDLNKLILLKSDKLTMSKLSRTGCMFCMFGVHLEPRPNRFEKMKITHPKQYDYCMNVLNIKKVLDYIGVTY